MLYSKSILKSYVVKYMLLLNIIMYLQYYLKVFTINCA